MEFPCRWGLLGEDNGKWFLAETRNYELSAALLQTWGFFSFIAMVLGGKVDRKLWERRGDPSSRSLFVQWPASMIETLCNRPNSADEERRHHPALEMVLEVCLLLEDCELGMMPRNSTVCHPFVFFATFLLLTWRLCERWIYTRTAVQIIIILFGPTEAGEATPF